MPRHRGSSKKGGKHLQDSSSRSTSSETLSVGAAASQLQTETPSTSPVIDVQCSICLQQVNHDLAKADGCLHSFCKDCIVQWSRRSTKCPICRADFQNILFSIRSDTEYEVLAVERPVFTFVPMLEFLREFVVTVEAPIRRNHILDDTSEVSVVPDASELPDDSRPTGLSGISQTRADRFFEEFVQRLIRNNPALEGRVLRAEIRRAASAPALLDRRTAEVENSSSQRSSDSDEDEADDQ